MTPNQVIKLIEEAIEFAEDGDNGSNWQTAIHIFNTLEIAKVVVTGPEPVGQRPFGLNVCYPCPRCGEEIANPHECKIPEPESKTTKGG